MSPRFLQMVALTGLIAAPGVLLTRSIDTDGLVGKAAGPRVTWEPAVPVQGDPLLIEVTPGFPVRALGGRFLGKRLEFFPWGPGTWRALTPVPVGTYEGEYTVRVVLVAKAGRRSVHKRVIQVRPGDFADSELSVDPKFTAPPFEVRSRIRKERKQIRKAWKKSDSRRLWRGHFEWPLVNVITSEYGKRRVFNDVVKSRHLGLDIDGGRGDPIVAAARGRVVLADHLYYTGRCVFIDHGLGMFTVYFHMSKLHVRPGQMVEAGEIIGEVGRSGRVTGPHLHFGAKISGSYVNPERLLVLDIGPDPKRIARATVLP